MTLRPRTLPKVRAQTLRRLETLDLTADQNPFMRPGDDNINQMFTRHLRVADLYWASADMTALSVHAGASLAAARWATADRPSPVGLIAFEDGLGQVDAAPGITAPVQALAWGPGPDRTLIVWHILDGVELLGSLSGADVTRTPRLLPVREARLPVTAEPLPLDDLPVREGMRPSRTIMGALAAAWHLMQQPQLVDRQQHKPDRAEGRALRRASMPDDGVTLVSLRRQYTPQDRDADAGGDGRRYRHRWIVSGHWRNQAHGPARSLRRQTWVPAHVKGPDGAPLMATEKVNVWRR